MSTRKFDSHRVKRRVRQEVIRDWYECLFVLGLIWVGYVLWPNHPAEVGGTEMGLLVALAGLFIYLRIRRGWKILYDGIRRVHVQGQEMPARVLRKWFRGGHLTVELEPDDTGRPRKCYCFAFPEQTRALRRGEIITVVAALHMKKGIFGSPIGRKVLVSLPFWEDAESPGTPENGTDAEAAPTTSS